MARVSRLEKIIIGIMVVLGILALMFGNSIGTPCLCPEGVIFLCPDNGLIYRIAGAILLVAGIGWAFLALSVKPGFQASY